VTNASNRARGCSGEPLRRTRAASIPSIEVPDISPTARRALLVDFLLISVGASSPADSAILCFHRHSGFVPVFEIKKPGFTPRRKARQDRKVSPSLATPNPRRGAVISPLSIRSGYGWSISAPILCFHIHSGFVPSILLLKPGLTPGLRARTTPNPSLPEEGSQPRTPLVG
jgi:hypothetical protein